MKKIYLAVCLMLALSAQAQDAGLYKKIVRDLNRYQHISRLVTEFTGRY